MKQLCTEYTEPATICNPFLSAQTLPHVASASKWDQSPHCISTVQRAAMLMTHTAPHSWKSPIWIHTYTEKDRQMETLNYRQIMFKLITMVQTVSDALTSEEQLLAESICHSYRANNAMSSNSYLQKTPLMI